MPATNGFTVIDREGTEQGSPDQAFPKFKSTGIIDWTLGQVRRLADRPLYSRASRRRNGNQLGCALLHRHPAALERRTGSANGIGFAIGANNLFNVDPPACFTCGLNNMDPTTYDVPGTFFYGRVTFRM